MILEFTLMKINILKILSQNYVTARIDNFPVLLQIVTMIFSKFLNLILLVWCFWTAMDHLYTFETQNYKSSVR